MKLKYEYKAKVINVVDGDTFDALVDVGFNIYVKERFRLYGVNTPELKGKSKHDGYHVKKVVEDLINDKDIILLVIKKGTFSRWIAQVAFPCEGPDNKYCDLGSHLLAHNLAVPYKKK